MSKVGYPYDNAPMERYFNTLKNECTNLYSFETEESLYQTVEEFAYVTYNHVPPAAMAIGLPIRKESQYKCIYQKLNIFLATGVTKKLDHYIGRLINEF